MTPYILEFRENVEPKNANDIIFYVKKYSIKYSFCENSCYWKFESKMKLPMHPFTVKIFKATFTTFSVHKILLAKL